MGLPRFDPLASPKVEEKVDESHLTLAHLHAQDHAGSLHPVQDLRAQRDEEDTKGWLSPSV